MSANEVDLELKKAFTELHQKTLETNQKVKIADVQIESLKRAKQRSELTSLEIKSLDGKTTTYESVGRMFILTPADTVIENLNSKAISCAEKIKTLESNKAFLEKSMEDFENNLREMVKQKKYKLQK